MENSKTLKEFLKFFKGQRIHKINLLDDDGYICHMDIKESYDPNRAWPFLKFGLDSWFLHWTEKGGADFYPYIVDKWNLFTNPLCKTKEGYDSEEYEDNLEHDYLCLDIWVKKPN